MSKATHTPSDVPRAHVGPHPHSPRRTRDHYDGAPTRSSAVAPSHPTTLQGYPGQTADPLQHVSETTSLLGPRRLRAEVTVGASKHLNPLLLCSSLLWEEICILAKNALPVFGTQLLEYSLLVVSVVSIGHVSTLALAASTLGSMTANVTGYIIIQGLSNTLDTMLPSAWTSSQPSLVGLWTQRMAVVVSAVLVPVAAVWYNSEPILLWLGQDPEVAHLAAVYLRVSLFGLPAFAFNTISCRYFLSQGLYTVPIQITSLVAPINALLSYALVWGPEPIRLGFIGAPISTAISFNLMSLASIIYGVFLIPHTAWHPFSTRCFTNLWILVKLGIAGVGQTASEWWCWELVALAASSLGPVSLASQSVLLVSSSTTFQAPSALSIATSVRIGNLLGEGNSKRAGVSAKAALLISIMIAFMWSTMFTVLRRKWAYIFNDDPLVVDMVSSILPIIALFQVPDGLVAVAGGILQALGKQFIGAFLNITAYYMIGIPLGLWLTFRHNMGLHGLWIGLTVALTLASIFGVWFTFRTNWEEEVQLTKERLKEDTTQSGPASEDV